MSILEKLQPIFKDIFDDESLVVTEDTVATDIEDWDSFAQMHIIMLIEEMFAIKFSTDEVTNFKNVGDIVRNIETHIN